MKRTTLIKTNLLEGQHEEISATNLRAAPGDILSQVQMGKAFTVTKNGKVIAEITKPEPSAAELGAAIRRLGLLGLMLFALPLFAHGQELTKQSSPEPVKAGLQTGQDGRKTDPSLSGQNQFRSRGHYDWSFVRDPKFYAGVSFSFAVTQYDISTSHGPEHTRLLRGSNGELSKAKYYGITAITNAGFLPLDLMRDHRWRYASLFSRVGLALWRLNGALHNGGQR